jgi:hypothetical protein
MDNGQKNTLKDIEDAALAYPGVSPSDFLQPFFFSKSSSDNAFNDIDPHSIIITEGRPLLLPGAEREVPSYTIEATTLDGVAIYLENRIALIGIGSNSSQTVLARKFQDFKPAKNSDLEIVVVPAVLKNFAVVHGGFLGFRGPVPATLYEHKGTESTVTVGFYDAEAAAQLTRTEPNYEGVLIESTAKLEGSNVSIKNPLAYVSIWGALQDPAAIHQPLEITEIPSETSLNSISSKQALKLAYKITEGIDLSKCPAKEVDERLRAYIRENFEDEALRFRRIGILQKHSLPSNVQGKRVFKAGLSKERVPHKKKSVPTLS